MALSFFNFFSSDIGIDLGTANTLIYIKGKGIVVNHSGAMTVNFTVPNLPVDKLTADNSLSVAFRLIGSDQNSECLIHSIDLVMENTTPP